MRENCENTQGVSQIKLIRCHHSLLEYFRPYHYWPDVPVSKVARCFLVEMNGKRIGFVASMFQRGKFGDDPRPPYRAHRTAVLLPVTHPAYFRLWALCADAQAEHELALGHRFWSTAPSDHAAYRDNPASGWIPSASDGKKVGYRSHHYVGVGAGPKPVTYECSACHGVFEVQADKVQPHYTEHPEVHGTWHPPVNPPDIKGWSSMNAGEKRAYGVSVGCRYCIKYNSARSCPAHGWTEKRNPFNR